MNKPDDITTIKQLNIPPIEPTLSPKFTKYIEDYIVDLGGNPSVVLGENSAYCELNEDSDVPVPLSVVVDLFKQAEQFSGDHHIGLTIAQQYHYESAGIVIMLVMAAPDVRTAISVLCQRDKQVDLAINAQLKIGPKLSSFHVELVNPVNLDVMNLNEFLLALFVDILRKGTRKVMPIVDVWLQHEQIQSTATLQKFFGAPIKTNQSTNKVVFDSVFLGEKMNSSNKLLFKVLGDTIDTYYTPKVNHGGFVAEVCARIVAHSSGEPTKIDDVANSMAMTGKTLSRRLSDEGVSFQKVKQLAREQLAKSLLLNTSSSLSEISFRLGYSELSAFSRAFRSWVGVTPHEFRDGAR